MPHCNLRRRGVDLAQTAERQALLTGVATESQRVLVLTEGVVSYLTVDEAGVLATDLHSHPAFAYWVVDRFSSAMIRLRRQAPFARQLKHAPLQFLPEDWDQFFAIRGWRQRELKSLAVESQRLGRGLPPGMPWWAQLIWPLVPEERKAKLNAMAGYALLERV